MSFSRSIGRFGARVGGNQELIEGVLEGVDPALVAEVINRNSEFLTEVISRIEIPDLLRSIDQKVLKEVIDEALNIFSDDVSLLDLDKVAGIINAFDYQRMGEMLMRVDPNILGIALGILLWSFRKATVAPGIFVADEDMETLNISPDIIKPEWKKRNQ
jgi:hypothetical protein